jgi:hypothetical protein
MRGRLRAAVLRFVAFVAVLLLAVVPASAKGACRAQQLKLSQGAPDGGAGHFANAFQVTNSSHETCTLQGVPRLHLLDRQGRVVDAPVCAGCGDYLFGAKAAEPVELKPGASANFLLGAFHGDAAHENCHTFARIQVELAALARPLEFQFHGGDVATCGLNESPWIAGLYNEDEDPPGPAIAH